jgi:hypothetical protein
VSDRAWQGVEQALKVAIILAVILGVIGVFGHE